MLTYAGRGVAFCTSDEMLEKIADNCIKVRNFEPLLALA